MDSIRSIITASENSPPASLPSNVAASAGFAGTTVSFVNFKNELPYFIEQVFPLLREAGLRTS